ncbi:MAG: peptide/nickel transport system permease protein [Thermomicrobiales bacterium]|nr:peptide/nickel transport system permease protein [Thermomicrobiales bacterium]
MSVRPLTIDHHAESGPVRQARNRTRSARVVGSALAVFRRQPIATAVVLVFLVVGALAPVLAPDDPAAIHMRERLQGPSGAHWLGTDEYGRDLLSRVLYGARIAFQAGIIAVGIAMIGGVLIGLVAGYFGGSVDYLLSRVVEGLQAFPVVLLAIAITAVWGPSVRHAMVSIGIATIPDFARITRGVVLPTKEQPYVEAARVVGCGNARILRIAILPNCLPAITVLLSFSIANSILYESALSFLGLGAQPPQPSWGTMLSTAKSYMFDHPSYTLVVGLALSLTIIALNLFGDAVREVVDPLVKT